MEFSTMVLSMYVDTGHDDGGQDERVLAAAVDQSLTAAGPGFNPWSMEHHFRGPWHSAPLQFAAYVASQLPEGIRLGFGVLPDSATSTTTPGRPRAEGLGTLNDTLLIDKLLLFGG